MLSIGEFSKIVNVSAKTLRHYAKIGLIQPEKINPDNGYRYYSINQLETMLLINRLKTYQLSLEEIKQMLTMNDKDHKSLSNALIKQQAKMTMQRDELESKLQQLERDILLLKKGTSIMSYLHDIDVQLVDIPSMVILSIQKQVRQQACPEAYSCFRQLQQKINEENLTMTAPPMAIFHTTESNIHDFDIEFAIPIQEHITGSKTFYPGLCIKSVLHGSYSQLPSIYARQQEWIDKEGYECVQSPFEIYPVDPYEIAQESDLITEVYCPVKKK